MLDGRGVNEPLPTVQAAHPRAYIGEAGGPEWPYSVAWISQRLAEPRTRVRIAVGPPVESLKRERGLCLLSQALEGRGT